MFIKRRWLMLAAVSIFSGITFAVLLPRPAYLFIFNETQNTLVYKVMSEKVADIHYEYQQSYDRGTIEEVFELRDGNIVPTVMTFDTDSYDYHGSRYEHAEYEFRDDRWYVFIREHPGYPEIKYRVGYTIEQEMCVTLNNEKKRFKFQDVGEPGDMLLVTQRKR